MQYKLKPERKTEVMEGIDARSVNARIADDLSEELFGENDKLSDGMKQELLNNIITSPPEVVKGLIKPKPQSQEPLKPPSLPQRQERESTDEERANTERFLEDFVVNNDGLTQGAKDFITREAHSRQGPWSAENNVKSVEQDGSKIFLHLKSGRATLYME